MKTTTLKEALLQEREGERVRCRLCPWLCLIADGKRGVCGVRLNQGGTLYSLIYGKVSSAAVDPIEKKPLFHFYPGSQVYSLGTFGCNMRCKHCQNWQISCVSPAIDDDRLAELPPEKAVKMAQSYGCQGIAWTYNEPTIWFEYTLDSARLARSENLYTVYVTNGYITLEALDMIGPYLEAFRVDVKGFTKEFYRDLAKIPNHERILEAAVYAKKHWGMHVEVVTNIIPTMNDDEPQLTALAQWIASDLGSETPWHVTRFIPQFELTHLPPTPVATLERARDIGLKAGLDFVYVGNIPGHAGENTFCPTCGEMVIERSGFALRRSEVEAGRHRTCGTDLNIREDFRDLDRIASYQKEQESPR